MKVAAIVSEFNPFHNGHKLLTDYCKKELHADYIICIMSGDFVQRGLPAFMDKETRTKMALSCGVDAVLLLPTVFSTMSAELFAYSSVYILDKLNCVDYLVFGSESGDITEISACAKELFQSEDISSGKMQQLLKQGNTFAKARAMLFPEYSGLLSEPNNTLGIEYCLSLLSLKSSIVPVTIKRSDNGYNSGVVNNNEYASAKAIRSMMESGNPELQKYIPYEIWDLYKKAGTLSINDFSRMLYYALLTNKESLTDYSDVSEDFAAKIAKNLPSYTTAMEFAGLLKSKDLTHTGITRALIHIFLGIKGSPSYFRNNLTNLSHIRLLGISSANGTLLSTIKEKSRIKVITKVPDFEHEFNSFTKEIYDTDLFAFTLYDKIMDIKYGCSTGSEYSKIFINCNNRRTIF